MFIDFQTWVKTLHAKFLEKWGNIGVWAKESGETPFHFHCITMPSNDKMKQKFRDFRKPNL